MPAAQTGMKLFFSCFKNVAVHGYGLDHLPPGMCVTDAPGPAKWHLLIMEPIRLVLLYYAAYLLYSEGGYGGIEEIKVRARARARARVTVTVTVTITVRVRVRVRVGPLILKATLLAEGNRAISNPTLNRGPGPAFFAQPWPQL